MNPLSPIIHIGLPKCASSFLQRIAFPEHPEIHFSFKLHKKLLHSLIDFNFDFDVERFRETLIDSTPICSEQTPKQLVLSYEGLSGLMFTGQGARHAIDLCSKVFDEPRIIIVLRRQYDIIYSMWNHYVLCGGTLSIKNLLSSSISPANPLKLHGYNVFSRLMYDDYVDYLFTKFGRQNVNVMLYEDLGDFPSFCRRLYSFIGVDDEFLPNNVVVRKQLGYPIAQLFRITNHFVKSNANTGGILPFELYRFNRRVFNKISSMPFLQQKCDCKQFVPESVREKFRQSNQRLGSLLERDLAGVGYEI